MPKSGWTTITLRTERLQALEKMYERDKKRPKNQKFGAWFDNFVEELTESDSLVERYGKFIEVESITESHILLLDNIAEKHYFVKILPTLAGLMCEQDESGRCVHVGYCLAIPKVYKALIMAGYRTQEYMENNTRRDETENGAGIRQGYGYWSQKELDDRRN
jgi:serine/threonine-protein kinase RIO1